MKFDGKYGTGVGRNGKTYQPNVFYTRGVRFCSKFGWRFLLWNGNHVVCNGSSISSSTSSLGHNGWNVVSTLHGHNGWNELEEGMCWNSCGCLLQLQFVKGIQREELADNMLGGGGGGVGDRFLCKRTRDN